MTKYVYFFGSGSSEGSADMKNLLGGKGANLAEMTNLGIPVPAGFTITTESCVYYYKNGQKLPEGLEDQVEENLKKLEKAMGMKFNDRNNPLLVSVRSGARVSMPGMMDTVLNLGINDEIVAGFIEKTGNPRFGWDSYRRFIQMYSNVVMDMDSELLEHILEEKKKEKGVKADNDLTADDLKSLIPVFKAKVKEYTGKDFPTDPMEQLWGAIKAVFNSWENDRAIRYRKLNNIPSDWGTAVNVQAMVYGNMGEDCATGVAFTRDPSTGEKIFYGEFLQNAQGEDVVAGIRTPHPLRKDRKTDENLISLEELMPEVYQQLVDVYKRLENHYKDMQDIEFTIQNNVLYMLQTRNGKRTAAAALKIAVDMVNEGAINKTTAVKRVAPSQLDQLLHPTFDVKDKATHKVLAKGLPASPGAAVGKVVFNAHDAEEWAELGEKVILVRVETSPEDIGGMNVAQGILTARGGMTSHAAVVARGMGKCCVAGCGDVSINYKSKTFTVGDVVIKEGDIISLDGSTGEVFNGEVKRITPDLGGDFEIIMKWADELRTLGVRTNADTPNDAAVARKFGAEGIGLCRTEHMFFEGDRIKAMREMILSSDVAGREKALAKLLPMQKADFKGIFEAMNGLPVTIRLLDPPLHEFLPHEKKAIEELATDMGVSVEKLESKIESLKELNPMLGHRGCRLAITYPEIARMQARAIIEAACEIKKEKQVKVLPEIMIPLIGDVKELKMLKEEILAVAKKVISECGVDLDYTIGTMIEIPRAALLADEIAAEAEFFSFGTNDLTQMTFGFSRDDAGVFLPDYVEKRILEDDPFQTLDKNGVGKLVEMGVKLGRQTNPKLKVGICGEHGGDPRSVDFCHKTGLNYVSCSPYRVPIARLAAAHAAIDSKK
ncbi:MAG: pyruvate, phosphate dikinase [Candidatus Auribacterota bacterium]|jgi:pyruvate,orthophosphate dikinase|nr:pyruvate, phosphate dikinase [Candidatus Auribacterota bacterium]